MIFLANFVTSVKINKLFFQQLVDCWKSWEDNFVFKKIKVTGDNASLWEIWLSKIIRLFFVDGNSGFINMYIYMQLEKFHTRCLIVSYILTLTILPVKKKKNSKN